ncbi:hypothetical protein TWF225_010841 [Orbilia oligospora]|nr:hypothetical protein TWF225_010841 [Orbilia oligospora]KAF3252501.1 hypothetical protein TWF217_007701 [Orbilia oligospora]KAF3271429.1 hypothetical protein TWF128_000031 [Orbilia oligospora]
MEYELRPVRASAQQEKSGEIYHQPAPASHSDASISPIEGNIVSETASIRQHDKVVTGWMPLVLRPWSLFIFLLVFIGIFITLIGLYVRSKREQGLSNERESRHYLWTYGPTAVFIVLAAFWRHLDYQVKLLMPYVELAKGPKHAKLTVMLDYISPFQPVAFWYACKNRHWLVILSATAFATLKIAVIFATGLFILQGTALQTADKDFLRYQNQFSAVGFKPDVDARASLTVFGVTALNLSYPAGTSHDFAIQTFSNFGNVPLDNIASISVPADVFSAKLDCQPARLEWIDDRDLVNEITPLSQFYNTTAFVPGCTLKKIRLDAPGWLGNDTQQGYYGRIQNSTCQEIQDPVAANRLFVGIAYSTRFNYLNSLRNYTAFVCTPSYTIQRNEITIPHNRLNDYSQISSLRPLSDASSIPGFTPKDLTDAVYAALAASYSQLNNGGWDRSFDPFFTLMSAIQPQLNYTAFMEPDILKPAAEDLYVTLAAQIAGSSLTQPTSDTTIVNATVSKIQQRLILRPVSVIVMEIIVAILIFITILLSVMIPRQGVAPRDPSSIGAVATILSRSRSLEQSLSGTSNLSEKDLETWLHRYRFYSTVEVTSSGRIFKIELADVHPNSGDNQRYSDETKLPEPAERSKWWKPLGLKWWVIIPLVVFPIAIIVALEVLYRKSVRDQGLAYIPDGGYVHYTWVFVPAFVMVVIVTLFNMLDYATRCIAPYQAMRADSTVASRGILYNPNGKLTLPALWFAIKEKHVTVIATTFAVLIAPVLTIAVSGLFYSQLAANASTLTVQQDTWFNVSFPDYNVNTTDDIISSLIVSGNLSYPRWTYEDLAFGELSVLNDTTEAMDAADSVTVSVPAVRSALNCSIIPRERHLELRLGQEETIERGQNLTELPVWVNISMPDQCGNSGTIFNNITWLTDNIEHPQTGYFGHVLPISSFEGENCPKLAVFYGKMNNNKIANFSTLFCSGYTQSLEVETTFLLPDFMIDTTTPGVSPPKRREETARWFSNQSVSIEYSFATLKADSSSPDIFDDFIRGVVYGKNGMPPEELLDPEKLMEGTAWLYAVSATQTLNQDTRIPNANGAARIEGVSRTRPRSRLVQSLVSTRVLQVLLAFIMLTTVVAYIGVKARELLPRESNSIATVGGYLAGSDVLRLVPDGAEWGAGGKGGGTGSQEVFAGYMFGFGWWEDTERAGRRRYGVGIGRGGGRTSPS